MTERECIEELKAKGWTDESHGCWGNYCSPDRQWWIVRTSRWELRRYGLFMPAADSLQALLCSTMPGSAGVTVAGYFGLRNPGAL